MITMREKHSTLSALLRILSDGNFHSGESLGAALGLSRAAVWKSLAGVETLGVPLISVKGRGYQIPGGLALIDEAKIRLALPLNSPPDIAFHVLPLIDSTNDFLLSKECIHNHVAVAEYQSAGRGRRGRKWISPFGQNIYLSLGHSTSEGVAHFDGLSLAVGLSVVKTMEHLGFSDLKLKWPNDILFGDRKLSGVLIEIRGDILGDAELVVGLGVNYRVNNPDGLMSDIAAPWIDLNSIALRQSIELPDRNQLIATLTSNLLTLLKEFPSKTFSYYLRDWERRSAYLNQAVVIQGPRERVEGVFLGLSDAGSIRIACADGEKILHTGDLSLRALEC